MLSGGNPFRQFWLLGYQQLLPIIPPDADISERSSLNKRIGTKSDGRGKTPGTKGRDGLWSSFDWIAHPCDENDLDRWAAMGAGVGVRTGGGLIAIDADTLDTGLATVIRDCIGERLGRLPVRIGQHPKAIYICRVDGPLPYQRIEFGTERVEVLTEGRQFVAAGVHPKTLRPYSWPRDLVPYDELPVFKPEHITGLLEALRAALPAASKLIVEGSGGEVSQASLRGSAEAVRRAVSATPNSSNHFPSRESYVAYGLAIKAALPDDPEDAYDIWLEWCSRWESGDERTNDPDVVAADWSRMKPPFRRGASWLYETAEQYGDFDRASVWHEPVPDLDISQNLFSEGSSSPGRRLTLTSLQDAAASALTHSTRPLVKGLLDQGTLSVMYGPSNVGKTFVAMDIAFRISAGLKWGGMKTTPGTVLYVAAEGGAGARKRAQALRLRYPEAAADFQFHLASIDLLRPDADIGPLIATIEALNRPLSLLVLDTLSRVMAGGEENGSVDMGTMVKHFDRIRKATGAHVMVVHHSGKDQARGSRGHSSLRAATDTEIEISEGQIAVTKQRDLDKSFSSAFRLDVVKLGVDEDGEDVTSCTVDLVLRHVMPTSPATATEQIVFDALTVLVSASDGGASDGAKVADILSYLGGQNIEMGPETVRSHLKNLARKNYTTCPKRGIWAPKSGRFSSTGSSFTTYDIYEEIQEPVESGRESGRNVFE